MNKKQMLDYRLIYEIVELNYRCNGGDYWVQNNEGSVTLKRWGGAYNEDVICIKSSIDKLRMLDLIKSLEVDK